MVLLEQMFEMRAIAWEEQWELNLGPIYCITLHFVLSVSKGNSHHCPVAVSLLSGLLLLVDLIECPGS